MNEKQCNHIEIFKMCQQEIKKTKLNNHEIRQEQTHTFACTHAHTSTRTYQKDYHREETKNINKYY